MWYNIARKWKVVYYMTSSERNLVLMIAKGEVKEEDLKTPLTDEMKEELEFTRELMAIHERNGYGDLNKAMCIDE